LFWRIWCEALLALCRLSLWTQFAKVPTDSSTHGQGALALRI
jgi:hypothetical protein